MVHRWLCAVLVGACVACAGVQEKRSANPPPVAVSESAIHKALSSDPDSERAGIAALRAQGPLGLERLLAFVRDSNVDRAHARRVIDAVAAQRDAHVAKLFWHTDLQEARARAARERKPILSLRLLGRLDQDLSCANSRFFRLALYSHPEIANLLRDQFVLHWESERPAPRISIDFGDGRRIERTITGNSAHYVLDAKGRVIDALPGMYGPRHFLQAMKSAHALAKQSAQADDDDAAELLTQYHRGAVQRIESEWARELSSFGIALPAARPARKGSLPNAAQAAPVAVTKMAVEAPLVRAVLPSARQLSALTDAGAWQAMAKRRLDGARLHPTSRALIREKTPVQLDPATGETGPVDESGFERLIAAFEQQVAFDTIQNEYLLHRRIHEWLAARAPELADLNRRVYAELFLTPKQDPWLGLLPPDTLSGLPRDGVTLRAK